MVAKTWQPWRGIARGGRAEEASVVEGEEEAEGGREREEASVAEGGGGIEGGGEREEVSVVEGVEKREDHASGGMGIWSAEKGRSERPLMRYSVNRASPCWRRFLRPLLLLHSLATCSVNTNLSVQHSTSCFHSLIL